MGLWGAVPLLAGEGSCDGLPQSRSVMNPPNLLFPHSPCRAFHREAGIAARRGNARTHARTCMHAHVPRMSCPHRDKWQPGASAGEHMPLHVLRADVLVSTA